MKKSSVFHISILKNKLAFFMVLFAALPVFAVKTNKISVDMVEFDMVEIPKTDFQMMTTEITQKIYKNVTGFLPEGNDEGDDFPVKNVSFIDALIFCNKLSQFCNLEPVYSINGDTNLKELREFGAGNKEAAVNLVKINTLANGFRLPTEKEWKTAANGGNPDFRDRIGKKFDDFSWVFQNSAQKVHQVGTKKPNSFGIYDLTGNVAEWVYEKSDYFSSANRVMKGGHFRDFPQDLLYRNSSFVSNTFDWVGIRVISSKFFTEN